MARDDRLKKVQNAGADFLDTARTRAEEFLRELSRAGGDTQGRAQGAIDDLVEGGRRGTEQLVSVIRKEITNQLGLLGLATKEDLDRLERRLGGPAAAAGSTAGTATKRAARPGPATARRATAAKTAAASKKAANRAGTLKRSATTAKASTAKKSAARSGTAGATKKAAATKKTAR